MKRLLFVYNTDVGLLNDLRGAVQKAFGRMTECSLCNITYGVLSERPAWKVFRETLKIPAVFYYRDDMPSEVRGFLTRNSLQLPVILLENAGSLQVAVTAEQMENCRKDEKCLIALLQSYLGAEE